MIVYRREETVNKADKSPGDIECYCDGKKDHTAKLHCILRKNVNKSNASQKK